MNVTIEKNKNSLWLPRTPSFVFEVGEDFLLQAQAGRHPPIYSIFMVAAWSIYLYLYTQMY